MYVLESTLSFFSLIIPILICVAIVTLLERKILGLSQLRLGPNTVIIAGILQPFADAVKFLIKQFEVNTNRNNKLFMLTPVLILILVLLIWCILPTTGIWYNFNIRIIIFLTILSIGVYPTLLTGWSSNSNYAVLGSLRGVAQTISYEIRLGLVIMVIIGLNLSFDLFMIRCNSSMLLVVMPSIVIIWVVITIAEANRTPFDFAEGERELVSGFNVEYASVGFVLIFLREYAMLVLFGSLTSRVIFNRKLYTTIGCLIRLLIIKIWIIIRGTLPRFRYDLLISLAWKTFLPVRLGLISLSILY